MRKRLLFGTILLLASTGCVATRQNVRMPNLLVTVEDPSKARVYVFREGMSSTTMFIIESGTPIGEVGNGNFLCWEREPGKMTLVSRFIHTRTELEVMTEAGKAYYFASRIANPPTLTRLSDVEGKSATARFKSPVNAP